MDSIKKLVLALIAAQLKDAAGRKQIHDFVNGEVEKYLNYGADQLDAATSPLAPLFKVLALELKSASLRSQIEQAVDKEVDVLVDLLLAQIKL